MQEYEESITRVSDTNCRSTEGEVEQLCIGKAVGDYRRSIRQVLEWYSRNSVGALEEEKTSNRGFKGVLNYQRSTRRVVEYEMSNGGVSGEYWDSFIKVLQKFYTSALGVREEFWGSRRGAVEE